jgi:hypothetical protein
MADSEMGFSVRGKLVVYVSAMASAPGPRTVNETTRVKIYAVFI